MTTESKGEGAMPAATSVGRRAYTFAVMPWGYEVTWVAASEREAHRMAFNALAHDVQDRVECLDMIDVVEAA